MRDLSEICVGIPRALPCLSLPRPTAKKPLLSKQYERGLCGGERIDQMTGQLVNWMGGPYI